MQPKWFALFVMIVLVFALVACSSTSAPAPAASATQTPASSNALSVVIAKNPPAMPVDHAGRTECLSCHQTGKNGAPHVPQVPDHFAPLDTKNQASVCGKCHQQAK